MVTKKGRKSKTEAVADHTNVTTATQIMLRGYFILDRQNSTTPRDGLDKAAEDDKEDEWDEEDYVDVKEDGRDMIDGSDEEEGDGEKEYDENEERDQTDDDGDEYEEDFVDGEAENSGNSQATFLPSTFNSDTHSNDEEEGYGHEDRTLSLVDELENLRIKSD